MAFVYKDSQVPFSTDRFAYGALIVKNRAATSARHCSGANSTAIRPATTTITLNGLLRDGQALGAQPPISVDSGTLDSTLKQVESLRNIQDNQQAHVLPGEPDAGTRFQAAGYTNWSAIGENIYAYASDPLFAHAGFFIDWGSGPGGMQSPAGHRANMLSSTFTEVGIHATAVATSLPNVGPLVVTEDFGTRSNYQPQIVGVVYSDSNSDAFYEPGEGLAGVTVKAVGTQGTYTTITWSSGGYELVAPAGQYSVTFSGGSLGAPVTKTIVLGSANVELDEIANSSASQSANVQSLTAKVDNGATSIGAGQLIVLTLTTSAPVAVAGAPSLQLNDNETAIYSSGSGTNTLTFTYMVQPGDSTPDLQVTGLNLPGGASIKDAGGNALSGSVAQDLAIKIDTSTTSATSVQQEVMGLYGALYGRAGEFPAYSFWVGYAGPGLNTGNAGSTAVTLAQATTLGQGFVNSQNNFFNQTYGALTDSQFINAMYLNIGGAAGDPNGIGYWSGLLAQAEAQGQSVQAARAGLVGQFVQVLVGFDTSHRLAGLTDQQWADALTRTETISNKIAVSLAYANASNGTGGSILIPAAVGDAAYNAAIKVLQGVTSDPHTVATALAGITNAVSHHDLSLI